MERAHRQVAAGAATTMMGQGSQLKIGDLVLQEYSLEAQVTPFELALIVEDTPQSLAGCFQYSRDVFEADTIRRLGNDFLQLLRSIVRHSQQPVDALRLLDDNQRHQLLVEFNASRTTPSRPETLHGPFVQQASRNPDRIAVQFGHEQWTYGQLERRANQLAHYLQSIGVRQDELVAVCVNRSPRMLVGLLGILKAGGAYVPVDPAFPARRIAHMCADSQPAVLLTERGVGVDATFPAEVLQNTQVVYLDDMDDQLARFDVRPPELQVPPSALAYVIYTSGSTGQPKGVMIQHAAIANFLHSMAERPGLGPADTLLGVTTLSFDICALELFLPLWVGARLVLADRESASDAPVLARLLQQSQATVMQATPATWHMLVSSGQEIPSRLKILVGGEALDAQLAPTA